jgi:hypothetical protein
MQAELRVRKLLGKTIIGEQYVINDFAVKLADGKSMQIDHIFINSNGIFVIETKNYSGIIYGDENSVKWGQYIKSYNRKGYAYKTTKSEFYNPVKQNKTHIYYLSEIINRNNCFKNIVLFDNHAKDIGKIRIYGDTVVTYINNIQRIIRDSRASILSANDMQSIFDKLTAYQVTNAITNQTHIQYIETMKKNIESKICPRCGQSLVLRKGKYSEFYGCSNYPKCEFTMEKE